MGYKKNTDPFEIEALEIMVEAAQKPYISYEEGMKLYSLGRNNFIEIARESGAVRKVRGRCLVNVKVLNDYIETMFG